MTDSPRVITLFCEGEPAKDSVADYPPREPGRDARHRHPRRPRHGPHDLDAVLVSDPRYTPETWRAEGADVKVEKLNHPDDAEAAPGMLVALGHQAERFIITCPKCGRPVELADNLGVGYTTMVAARESDAEGTGYRTRSDRLVTDRLRPSTGAPVPPPLSARPMRPDLDLAAASQPARTTNPALHEHLTKWADATADSSGLSRLTLSVLEEYA